MKPTKEYLLWLFDYDRERGVLIWKNHWFKSTLTRFAGKEAGVTDQRGYRMVIVGYKTYCAHQLIWFIEYGNFAFMLDHINGVRNDNRIENLRSVTNRQNQQNCHRHRKGKLVGCTFEKHSGKWISQIRIDNKCKKLGRFRTEQEAHERYLAEIRKREL